MKNLLNKYKDVIPYLFFGVCTTLVNIVAYLLFAHIFGLGVMLSTVIAWVAAVMFAYYTNKKWVFHSKNKGVKRTLKELYMFFCVD